MQLHKAEKGAGNININETTYELVKDKFKCEHCGTIAAKNKGEINMYFVEGDCEMIELSIA